MINDQQNQVDYVSRNGNIDEDETLNRNNYDGIKVEEEPNDYNMQNHENQQEFTVLENSLNDFMAERFVPLSTRSQRTGPLLNDSSSSVTDREYLPREIIAKIISISIQDCPSTRYTLQRVNQFFRHIVSQIPLPRIYIRPNLISNMPNPVSVRRLLQAAGPKSGIIDEIKSIIQEPRWLNAWLHLQEVEYRWFEILSIWWRKM